MKVKREESWRIKSIYHHYIRVMNWMSKENHIFFHQVCNYHIQIKILFLFKTISWSCLRPLHMSNHRSWSDLKQRFGDWADKFLMFPSGRLLPLIHHQYPLISDKWRAVKVWFYLFCKRLVYLNQKTVADGTERSLKSDLYIFQLKEQINKTTWPPFLMFSIKTKSNFYVWPCPCGFLNFAFSAKFWSCDKIFAFLPKIGHVINISLFLRKLDMKQFLSHEQFFSRKAKIFVTSPIFGKNAKISSHDQNLSEKGPMDRAYKGCVDSSVVERQWLCHLDLGSTPSQGAHVSRSRCFFEVDHILRGRLATPVILATENTTCWSRVR